MIMAFAITYYSMNRDLISVLLADEHEMYREALALTLAHDPSIQVIGQCGNGPEAEQLFRSLQPDLVLIDVTVRADKGFATTSRILEEHPEAKVIWLSTFFTEACSSRLVPAGVRGYMTKSMSYLQILDAIHKVHEGEVYTTIADFEKV